MLPRDLRPPELEYEGPFARGLSHAFRPILGWGAVTYGTGYATRNGSSFAFWATGASNASTFDAHAAFAAASFVSAMGILSGGAMLLRRADGATVVLRVAAAAAWGLSLWTSYSTLLLMIGIRGGPEWLTFAQVASDVLMRSAALGLLAALASPSLLGTAVEARPAA